MSSLLHPNHPILLRPIRIAFPMANEPNLHEMLYADADDNDFGLDMLEQMFQHRDLDQISKYYDIINEQPLN